MRITMTARRLPLKPLLIGTLAASILSLALYNARDIIFGAPLSVHTAKDGATIDGLYMSLSGTAPHARELRINGRTVTFDRKGAFTDGVVLSPGYNIVEIAASDRFGNEKKKLYHVVATPAPAAVASRGDTPYQ